MNQGPTILLVEDDRAIAGFLSTVLKANGFTVLRAVNGKEAMVCVTARCPELMLLDLGLPDMDGLNIIRSVRVWSNLPILVVSARTQERDKVAALDLGADDFITKPFGTAELLARVRAALRRRAAASDSANAGGVFTTGELTVDYGKHRVFLNGEDVHLTQNEYRILALLAQSAGRVLTYGTILREVWGPHAPDDNQILRVNMANIRRKLEANPAQPRFIFTEMGVGYRMAESDIPARAEANPPAKPE